MAEEIKSIFKSRNYWMAFAISFLTLLGYSLSSWLNAISVGESMEYRESALSLSVGGIFFGGFMLLFPFCASVAHATSQVDELRSGMARWRVMRGSVARYVGVKAAASMLAAALAKKVLPKPIGMLSLALLLGGAVGNFIDRLLFGFVTDMFATTFMNFPVFNVADIGVVVGGVLLCIHVIFTYSKEPKPEEKP